MAGVLEVAHAEVAADSKQARLGGEVMEPRFLVIGEEDTDGGKVEKSVKKSSKKQGKK